MTTEMTTEEARKISDDLTFHLKLYKEATPVTKKNPIWDSSVRRR
jgi:polyhydroxyalkanoate synthesis regulator phasin